MATIGANGIAAEQIRLGSVEIQRELMSAAPTCIRLLAQAMRLDLRPLAIRDDVAANRHLNLPSGKLESEIRPYGNPDTQQTLKYPAINLQHIQRP